MKITASKLRIPVEIERRGRKLRIVPAEDQPGHKLDRLERRPAGPRAPRLVDRMEALIYLDTHVVAWIFAGQAQLLSPCARTAIDQHTLRISPMMVLELELLKEIGRLEVGSESIAATLRARIGLDVCDLSFPPTLAAARQLTWALDPIDRIIVGRAVTASCPVLTKDRSIRRRLRETLW